MKLGIKKRVFCSQMELKNSNNQAYKYSEANNFNFNFCKFFQVTI